MADVALLVIAVDGLWVRLGLVPEDDRVQVLRAASAGIHVALQTRGCEVEFRALCRMLRLDAISIIGPGWRAERNGRLLLEAATSPEPVLAALIADLARSPDPFGRAHVAALGSQPADLPLLRAAGLSAWMSADGSPPAGETVDYVARPLGQRDSGVGQAVGSLVLRNNRFLRPPVPHPRFTVL